LLHAPMITTAAGTRQVISFPIMMMHLFLRRLVEINRICLYKSAGLLIRQRCGTNRRTYKLFGWAFAGLCCMANFVSVCLFLPNPIQNKVGPLDASKPSASPAWEHHGTKPIVTEQTPSGSERPDRATFPYPIENTRIEIKQTETFS
jgi:hypothetical protein